MEKVLEYLEPKTFNKVHYVTVGFWILISIIFFAIFVDMENSESRFDFRCGGAKSENVDVVRGECYEKYHRRPKLTSQEKAKEEFMNASRVV